MIKKTDLAREAFLRGDHKEALRIVKTFKRLSKEDKATFARGFECMVNPAFYASLGKNPEEEVNKAIELFKSHYIK